MISTHKEHALWAQKLQSHDETQDLMTVGTTVHKVTKDNQVVLRIHEGFKGANIAKKTQKVVPRAVQVANNSDFGIVFKCKAVESLKLV